MRIGFSKKDITPPIGIELGGYAGYRPNNGVHDPLYCKTIILEQEEQLYAMIALDLLCADESLCNAIAEAIACLGIHKEHLIIYAIHSHAAPVGVIPGEGPLAQINVAIVPDNPNFSVYMRNVIDTVATSCKEALEDLREFQVRKAFGTMPPVGLERHTGDTPAGKLSIMQFLTDNGKNLIFYSFPCHPTVLSAENLKVSADFIGEIECRLGVDMAIFANGAAGDISTRFTRKESSFKECQRMGKIAADRILELIEQESFAAPSFLTGKHADINVVARKIESEETAQTQLQETTNRWKQAIASGADAGTVRILKSYVEGAGVNLEFSRSMAGISNFNVPITVWNFAGLKFAAIPGELYSTLLPEGVTAVCYANGYYRYIADENAYDAGHYEALAAIVRRGSGELLSKTIRQLQD